MRIQEIVEVRTEEKEQFIDITSQINRILRASEIKNGLCNVYVPHTTAGVTINEGADSAVVFDILTYLRQSVPESNNYTHMEGNSHAHIKTLLTGSEKTIPVQNGSLQLGTWQKVFFCEYDGPRRRKFLITIVPA
ncbi:secondary thiamine-phosphate synthase enzyme [Desulfotomaculum arcticum]|uniref:Secondary thiamine-phosphate synthase enzyme n=1 Tax=Desulfotruncus arcticus DSM 17038 TaxID=1121424 RepID=A0A1I2NDG8_9FIRM|nr:secondary thiamine-phosphate synthase enzyme YjbQ [Desulfotruncus arcticus]SFG01975.1 secondary thiamine-phosphate synthase enzyme [Desulfotomaculum arcticum] [Desulfotruncus arcticus DSM 17038]